MFISGNQRSFSVWKAIGCDSVLRRPSYLSAAVRSWRFPRIKNPAPVALQQMPGIVLAWCTRHRREIFDVFRLTAMGPLQFVRHSYASPADAAP